MLSLSVAHIAVTVICLFHNFSSALMLQVCLLPSLCLSFACASITFFCCDCLSWFTVVNVQCLVCDCCHCCQMLTFCCTANSLVVFLSPVAFLVGPLLISFVRACEVCCWEVFADFVFPLVVGSCNLLSRCFFGSLRLLAVLLSPIRAPDRSCCL